MQFGICEIVMVGVAGLVVGLAVAAVLVIRLVATTVPKADVEALATELAVPKSMLRAARAADYLRCRAAELRRQAGTPGGPDYKPFLAAGAHFMKEAEMEVRAIAYGMSNQIDTKFLDEASQ
jgi:hypothetical protein